MEAVALARLPEYQQIAGALKALEVATAVAEDEALLILLRRPGWRYRYYLSHRNSKLTYVTCCASCLTCATPFRIA